MPALLRMAADLVTANTLSRFLSDVPSPTECGCVAAFGSSWRTPCMILDAIDLPELFGPMNTLSLCRPIAAWLIGPMFSSLISSNFIQPDRGALNINMPLSCPGPELPPFRLDSELVVVKKCSSSAALVLDGMGKITPAANPCVPTWPRNLPTIALYGLATAASRETYPLSHYTGWPQYIYHGKALGPQ